MPIKKCTLSGGGSGFKWGDKGKCFASKKDAIKAGVAIEGPQGFKRKQKAEGAEEIDVTTKDLHELLADLETSQKELIAIAFILDLTHIELAAVYANRDKKKKKKEGPAYAEQALWETGAGGEGPHIHTYRIGEAHTSRNFGHFHPILADGKILDADDHTHSEGNPIKP